MNEYIVRVDGVLPDAIYERETTEIVRCRDCEYYHDGTDDSGKRYVEPHCLAIGALEFGALFEVDESDFCSWGERKEVR